MAPIRGTAGDLPGGENQFGGASRDIPARSNLMDANRGQTDKIHTYLPGIARFLVVVTFFDGALRIGTQWSDQLLYLHDYRKFPTGLNHIFLALNIVTMVVCASLVIIRKYPTQAVAGLIGIVGVQALGYGVLFNPDFLLRNLSVVGGLLLVLSDARNRRTTAAYARLPALREKDRGSQMEGLGLEGSFEQALP